MDVYKSDITVELDGVQVEAFNVDNRMAICFSSLKGYEEYSYNNSERRSDLMLDTNKNQAIDKIVLKNELYYYKLFPSILSFENVYPNERISQSFDIINIRKGPSGEERMISELCIWKAKTDEQIPGWEIGQNVNSNQE